MKLIPRRFLAKDAALPLKDLVSVVQGIVATTAILIAGLWFVMQGEFQRRATLSIATDVVRISSAQTLLRVTVRIDNVGRRPFCVSEGAVLISQVLPLEEEPPQKMDSEGLPLEVFDWREIKEIDLPYKMKLSPGEYDSYYFETFIAGDIQMVRVYAQADNGSGGLWSAVAFKRIEEASGHSVDVTKEGGIRK